MTKQEALQIVEACKNWNESQQGFTPAEQAILDAKRAALTAAWRTLAEIDGPTCVCEKRSPGPKEYYFIDPQCPLHGDKSNKAADLCSKVERS